VATIRELRLLNSGWKIEIHSLKEVGVAADARESIQGDTATLATVTDTELEESDPIADVEEDEDELKENKLGLEDC